MVVRADRLFPVSGKPTVSETAALGLGTIEFEPACDCLVFRPGETPISWLENQKCADGAIVTADAQGNTTAHLVELKSKLGLSEWLSVRQQLEGILLNIRAAFAVQGKSPPASLRAYVAFKRETITPLGSASPALLKSPLGVPHPYATELGEWARSEVNLTGITVPLTKILRDEAGNGTGVLSV